jgi:hypothetical protein
MRGVYENPIGSGIWRLPCYAAGKQDRESCPNQQRRAHTGSSPAVGSAYPLWSLTDCAPLSTRGSVPSTTEERGNSFGSTNED